MHALIAGGAGFIGSHLADALLAKGWSVTVVDDLSTGRSENLSSAMQNKGLSFVQCDAVNTRWNIALPHVIFHLASPASPPAYIERPIETLHCGSRVTERLLQLAKANRAKFVLASTSEVYGDPLVHPQTEDYWGNVNPIGPRSVYDEAKRYAEAFTTAFGRVNGVQTRIARIFNTYGPRMRPDDGRVVTQFIAQAMVGEPLTVCGDGNQTRSFCYVDDTVRGLIALAESDVTGPVNIGNPNEITMNHLAAMVNRLLGSHAGVQHVPDPIGDDPKRRCPDITRANELLRWQPEVDLKDGLARTIKSMCG